MCCEPFNWAGYDVVWEFADLKITCSAPIPSNRTNATVTGSGNITTYMHMRLDQRTVPLGRSYPGCGNRTDGWCEMGAFLSALGPAIGLANFTYACFGNYSAVPYGTITNGSPLH